MALAARRVDRIEALAEEVQGKHGVKAKAVAMDVTDADSCTAAVDAAEAALGPLSIAINNAGVARPDMFLDQSEEDWDFTMDANLKGVWRVGQLVAKRMVASQTAGAIVNIASILGLGVGPIHSAYATSKGGVVHLTKSMATELFQYGIRVNAICPGYFCTEINADYLNSDEGKKYVSRTPPRRIGELDELNGPLLMFASDASTYVTGAILPVDGGHSIRLG